MDGLDVRAWADKAWQWIDSNVLTIQMVAQLGAVALMALTALGLGGLLSRWFKGKFEDRRQADSLSGRIVRTVERIIWLALFLILVNVARIAAESTGLSHRLLDIASSLALAWVAIRLASSLIANRFWARVAVWLAWTLAAIYVVGLWAPVMEFLDGLGMSFGDTYISVLQLAKGMALFVLLFQVAGTATRISSEKLTGSSQLSPSVQVLFLKVIKFGLYTVAFLLAVSSVGIDLTSLAVLSGAIGVGIGFGLQKIFSNLVSGVILLMEKSVKPGDTIEVGGVYGTVIGLNFRFAQVLTRDGKEYLIPNENLITNEVVIWTHQDPNVRLKIPVGVGYDTDLRKAMELMEDAARSVSRVLENPAPVTRLVAFGDNSVDLEIRVWIRDADQGVVNVRSEVLLNIWDVFQEHGVEIPFPQRDVHVKQLPPVRIEKE